MAARCCRQLREWPARWLYPVIQWPVRHDRELRWCRRPRLQPGATAALPILKRDSGEGLHSSCERRSARNVLRYWQPMGRNRRQQVFLRFATTARLSDFRSALTRCCSFDEPCEGSVGMAAGGESKGLRPANDNGSRSDQSLDPRILRIAEAIGRQLAREQAKPPAVANDNEPSPR